MGLVAPWCVESFQTRESKSCSLHWWADSLSTLSPGKSALDFFFYASLSLSPPFLILPFNVYLSAYMLSHICQRSSFYFILSSFSFQIAWSLLIYFKGIWFFLLPAFIYCIASIVKFSFLLLYFSTLGFPLSYFKNNLYLILIFSIIFPFFDSLDMAFLSSLNTFIITALKYNWPLNNVGIRGTDLLHSQNSVDNFYSTKS